MEERTCPRCGECFMTSHATKKYCSRQCGKAVENAKRRGTDVQPKFRHYYCAECGKHCIRGENVVAHASKFCSPECKKRDENRRLGPVRTMVKSQGTATQILRWQSLCAAKDRNFWRLLYVGQCHHCGNRRSSTRSDQTYCSKDCKRKAWRKKNRKMYPRKPKDRARKHGVNYEAVNYQLVVQRDGGVCQRCGVLTRTDVDMQRHDHARTVDHIIPMAQPYKGPHELWNLQVMCRRCNCLEKRDTLPENPAREIAGALLRSYPQLALTPTPPPPKKCAHDRLSLRLVICTG